MTTDELIAELRKADPTGDLQVTVGNSPIWYVHCLPSYYDGVEQVYVVDNGEVSGVYKRSGSKVSIRSLSFADKLWDCPDMPIDYSELSPAHTEQIKQYHDEIRKASEDIDYKSELKYFIAHIESRLTVQELDNIKEVCKEFFDANLNRNDPIPADIPSDGNSYVGRRNIQWSREVSVSFDSEGLVLTKVSE